MDIFFARQKNETKWIAKLNRFFLLLLNRAMQENDDDDHLWASRRRRLALRRNGRFFWPWSSGFIGNLHRVSLAFSTIESFGNENISLVAWLVCLMANNHAKLNYWKQQNGKSHITAAVQFKVRPRRKKIISFQLLVIHIYNNVLNVLILKFFSRIKLSLNEKKKEINSRIKD